MKVSLCWKCKEAPNVDQSFSNQNKNVSACCNTKTAMKCVYIPPSVLFFSVYPACVWTALRAVLWNSVCFVFLL